MFSKTTKDNKNPYIHKTHQHIHSHIFGRSGGTTERRIKRIEIHIHVSPLPTSTCQQRSSVWAEKRTAVHFWWCEPHQTFEVHSDDDANIAMPICKERQQEKKSKTQRARWLLLYVRWSWHIRSTTNLLDRSQYLCRWHRMPQRTHHTLTYDTRCSQGTSIFPIWPRALVPFIPLGRCLCVCACVWGDWSIVADQ